MNLYSSLGVRRKIVQRCHVDDLSGAVRSRRFTASCVLFLLCGHPARFLEGIIAVA